VGSIARAVKSPLFLILLLAFGLRLVNLEVRNLWYDEAFAVLFAEKGLDAMLYGTLTPVEGGASDIHPLLYYAALDGWMALFGQDAFTVRLWSVLLGVATVGVIYVLGRELFGKKTGLAGALITAITPFHIQYSQETRMYALMALLLMLATWCFIRGWKYPETEPQEKGVKPFAWWIAFGVLAGLAMYTQQLSAFYLVALGLVPILARRKRQIIGVMVGTTVAIMVYLPWLVNLPGQFNKVRSYYWLKPPNIAQPLLTVRSFLVVNLDIPSPASLIGFVGALFIILFLVVQIILYLRRRTRTNRQALHFILWLAATPVVLMWLVSQVQPVYLERALLPSALMLYLVMAWLFTQSGTPGFVTNIIGGTGLVLVVLGLYYQYTWATFPNSPFQPTAAYIRDNWQNGDVIVHQNKLSALPTIYYGRELAQHYLGDTPGSSEDTLALPTQQALGLLADNCIQAASREAHRIWFVVFAAAERQYESAGRPEFRETMNWLNTHYTPIVQERFNDLNVTLYADPHGDLSTDCEGE
jgi:mannosyltransferase